MNILALDPATKCGWATRTASGTWDLSVRRDESTGMKLIRLRGKLTEMHRMEPIDLIAFEAARHCAPGMQGALVSQAELQGVVKLWCEENVVQYRGYSPSEVKKHATGKGNANKEKMLAAAQAKWPGAAFVDDNEIDARWILDLATKEVG